VCVVSFTYTFSRYQHSGDRSLAQAVSRRRLDVEPGAFAHVSPCGICGKQSGSRTDLSLTMSPSAVFVKIISLRLLTHRPMSPGE
jgi:hypothetical protein